ncbi:MAG: GAF domain-containing protein [Acidobacteriota bacterium]|nr:GAF domain-containing protein [Acidobacteriota bacterium]
MELDRLQSQERLLDLAGDAALGASGLKLLEILHEVSVTLARTQTVEEVKEQSAQLLFKIDPVHRACVMLWDEQGATFERAEVSVRGKRASPSPASYDPRNLVLSGTILEHVRKHNRPLLIRDARSDQLLSSSASIFRAGIQAAFCSPLTFQGRFLGVLYADNLAAPDAFSEGNFRTFASIAAQTGLALANALARRELSKQQIERAAMRLYLPAQVMDLISASGGSIQLGGTLQPISVLFADIRGFTTLSERMDAREVVQMLNELFTAMSEVIFEAGGTLDKFVGDCVMALFGAPVAFEDSPSRALNAAIAMQRRVAALNRAREKRELSAIRIGIGIHHGLAVVGNIGSADRMQYTAIGDTVNIAARLVSRAAPQEIVVSGDFQKLVKDRCRFRPLGSAELKGREGASNLTIGLA